MDPSGHSWKSFKNDVKNTYDKGTKWVKEKASDAKDYVTDKYNKWTNTGSNSSSKGSSSKTSKGSSSSSGSYSYTTTSNLPTAAMDSYLQSQMEAPEPVDPVTASMQSRFGADAEVTKMTDSYVYVNGKLVTAMSDNEHKLCTTSKKIQTNGQKK